jgi:hypothetical protein
MLLRAEILRSVPLPTVSLFPKKKDIANSSGEKVFDIPFKIVVLKKKIDPYLGGFELKGEPRGIRGRPRRCNRGRNLPEPLS